MQDEPDIQMLHLSQTVLRVLGLLYPPALWLCSAMVQDSAGVLAGFVALSAGAFALVVRAALPLVSGHLSPHPCHGRVPRLSHVPDTVLRAPYLHEFRRVYQQYRHRGLF